MVVEPVGVVENNKSEALLVPEKVSLAIADILAPSTEAVPFPP